MRATAASRLLERNVPEKIIAERTGHRSLAGLRSYERTSKDQDQAASLSVVAVKTPPECVERVVNVATSSTTSNALQLVNNVEEKGIPLFSGTFNGCTFNF